MKDLTEEEYKELEDKIYQDLRIRIKRENRINKLFTQGIRKAI